MFWSNSERKKAPINLKRMAACGNERHCQESTGNGESTPSSGLKILVPDTEKVDPQRPFVMLDAYLKKR